MPAIVAPIFGARAILCRRCGRFVRPRRDDQDVPAGHVRPRSRSSCKPLVVA